MHKHPSCQSFFCHWQIVSFFQLAVTRLMESGTTCGCAEAWTSWPHLRKQQNVAKKIFEICAWIYFFELTNP